MDFTLYGGDNQGLIKLDPRTKILIFITSELMSLGTYSNIGSTVYVLALCIVLALCGKPFTALKSALFFGAVLYLRVALGNSGGAPYAIVIVLKALTTVFMFGFPALLSLYLIVKTTRISQFISAFQAMHLPIKVIVPVAVFFRFLPTVADEWRGIRKAMAFRGISLSPASVIRHPWKTIEYVLIPMLISSVSVMEELAAATMARGMDVDIRRSSYEEVKLKATDYILIAVFVGMLIFSVLMGELVKKGAFQ